MSDDQGTVIATISVSSDYIPVVTIGETELDRYKAIEAAAQRIAVAHRELADAYHAMDKLVGRSG